MIRVGLTGNIGSGKSTVGRIFEVLGAPVFHADASGRSVMMRDDVKHAIARHFGDHVVDGTGQIDRKALAGIVFKHPEELAWLNALIHPLVLEEYRIWHARQDAPYTIHEAAIVLEHGLQHWFDKIVLVIAPPALRMRRVMARDGMSEAAFQSRAAMQWNEARQASYADFLINNDEMQALLPQVLAVHNTLMGNT